MKEKFLFFKKAKILVVTSHSVYLVTRRRKSLKKRNKISELLGVTKSLLRGSTNFVMHFPTRAD